MYLSARLPAGELERERRVTGNRNAVVQKEGKETSWSLVRSKIDSEPGAVPPHAQIRDRCDVESLKHGISKYRGVLSKDMQA